jgi:uncharacterized membrane protein YvlD (DUF360 family)
VPGIRINGCGTALWGGVVLSLLNLGVELLFGQHWAPL